MKALLLVLIPAAAFASPHHAKDYLPSDVGARWELDGTTVAKAPNEIVVISSKDADGHIHVDEVEDALSTPSLVWWLEDGAWFEKPALGSDRGPHVILPASFDVGTTWHDDHSAYTVIAIAETVTLENKHKRTGVMRVQEMRGDMPDAKIFRWFAPGQGEIAVKIDATWMRSLRSFSRAPRR